MVCGGRALARSHSTPESERRRTNSIGSVGGLALDCWGAGFNNEENLLLASCLAIVGFNDRTLIRQK